MRAECVGHLKRVFQDIDVLVCPSMSAPAHPVTPEILYGPLPEFRAPKFQRFTVPFDFNGAPTLSVPCGLNSEDLPLSIQFVGKHLSEPLLCQVGHAYEQTTEPIHPQV
jgi:amidase